MRQPTHRPPDRPTDHPTPAHPSDHELLERALAAQAALDLRALTRLKWKCVGSADREFALHRRRSPSLSPATNRRGGQHRREVLCSGDVAASPEEVAAVLHATSEKAFEARMRALYGDAFIFGSLERSVAPPPRVEGGEDDWPVPHVAVKTISLVASDVLGKNEQWCFLELLHSHGREGEDSQGVTLSMGSLPPHEVVKGRLPASRVCQLHNLTAAYFVHALGTDNRAGVRVHFYGALDEDGDVSGRRAQARLQMLAGATRKLPELIRRRRLGVQVRADHSAFAATNARCTCCTRRFLALVSKKTRCYLCGFYVCEPCSLRERLEMCNGRLATIIVCRRCLDGLNACDYSQLDPSDDEGLVPRVLPDPLPPSRSGSQQALSLRFSTAVSMSAISEESSAFSELSEVSLKPTGGGLGSSASFASLSPTASSESVTSRASSGSSRLLMDELTAEMTSHESSVARKAAAMTVLGYLLDVPAPASSTRTKESKQATLQSIQQLVDRIHQARADLASLVHKALDVSAYPQDVASCELAGVGERTYPVMVPRSADKSDAVGYPVPENEAQRLDAIAQLDVDQLSNMDELDAICALAAAEMACPHGIVTLVERETVRIVAANVRASWDVGCNLPREQTFCQHFVMDERPLLVRYPEADVRFFSITPVVHSGMRFYAGFPVRARDGTVVGALCCLDARPREITRTQYWRLVRLAEAASRVVQASSESLSTEAGVVGA